MSQVLLSQSIRALLHCTFVSVSSKQSGVVVFYSASNSESPQHVQPCPFMSTSIYCISGQCEEMHIACEIWAFVSQYKSPVCWANVMEDFWDILLTNQQTNRCKNITASGGGNKACSCIFISPVPLSSQSEVPSAVKLTFGKLEVKVSHDSCTSNNYKRHQTWKYTNVCIITQINW